MLSKLKTLALAGLLSLGLLAVFSVANDRGGIIGVRDILNVGREYLPARGPAMAAQGTGCLPTTGTVSGLTFAQGVNSAIAALISSNSGASAPATDCTAVAIKGQVWLDTSVTPNVLRQYDGTSWVAVGALDATNHLWSPPVGGGTATVTASATTDICAAPSAVQTVTGTTPITSFGSACVVGTRKTLIFGSATPVTYNASSLILPGQRSYTATVGDMADVIYLGSGNWRVKDISKIDGSSVTNPAVPLATVLYGDFASIPPKTVVGAGQAISRSSYPDYLAAVTRSQTGTLTAGNTTITSVGNTRGLGAGMPLEGTGIQAGTTIASVTGSTIVMSAAATANGAQTVTAFMTGYGAGGDTNTVGVKNCIGKTIAGLDPAAASLSNASAMNSSQGSKSATLITDNLPPYTPSGGLTIYLAGGTTTTIPNVLRIANATILDNAYGVSGTPIYRADTLSQLSTAGSTFAGTAQGGLSAPFSLVQPTSVAECVIVVLP